MDKKCVLITGAASGIGFGIAQYLGQQGHQIVVVDINLDAAQEAVGKLQLQNVDCQALQLDVCDPVQVANLPQQLAPMKVDVVINNAGLQYVSRLEDFPAEKWQQLINVMLVGPALVTQALLSGMRERNYGRIINIGSLHSLVASPFKSAYIAAKHGLLGFAKTLALETGDCNITINTLCPAYVKTPLVEQQVAAQAKEHGISEQEVIEQIMLEPMPKKAFIEMDELAASAEFLMSHQARNITAQAIALDGGWTAR